MSGKRPQAAAERSEDRVRTVAKPEVLDSEPGELCVGQEVVRRQSGAACSALALWANRIHGYGTRMWHAMWHSDVARGRGIRPWTAAQRPCPKAAGARDIRPGRVERHGSHGVEASACRMPESAWQAAMAATARRLCGAPSRLKSFPSCPAEGH